MYIYDANGNLTSNGAHTYTWDARNRLSSSGSLSFYYDHFGSRYKTVDTSSGSSVYTYYLSPYEELRDGTPTYYIFAGGQRVAALEDSALTYYHQDHLGGTALTTNSKGYVTQVYDYYPYGSELTNTELSTTDAPHSFTDKEYEEDIGLYYFEARWYDSSIGRFTSQDPMQMSSTEKYAQDPQRFNYYNYAKNNPLTFLDPLGLEATIIIRDPHSEGIDFGHSAIEIDGNVYEFYQAQSTLLEMTAGVEGILDIDDGFRDFYTDEYSTDQFKDSFKTLTIETSNEQNESMINFFENLKGNTPDYKLFSNNCTTVIVDALESAGVADFYNGIQFQIYNKSGFTLDILYRNNPTTPSGLYYQLNVMDLSGEVNIVDRQYFSE